MAQAAVYSRHIRARVMQILEGVYSGEDELSSHIRLISVHSPKSAGAPIRITIRPSETLIWSREETIERLANQSIGDYVLLGESHLKYSSSERLAAFSHMNILLLYLDMDATGMQVLREHPADGIEAFYFGGDTDEGKQAQIMFVEKEIKFTQKRVSEMTRELGKLQKSLDGELVRLRVLKRSLELGKTGGVDMLICDVCKLVVVEGYDEGNAHCPVCRGQLHQAAD